MIDSALIALRSSFYYVFIVYFCGHRILWFNFIFLLCFFPGLRRLNKDIRSDRSLQRLGGINKEFPKLHITFKYTNIFTPTIITIYIISFAFHHRLALPRASSEPPRSPFRKTLELQTFWKFLVSSTKPLEFSIASNVWI